MIPQIEVVPPGVPRPKWSVMIPTYNQREDYLRQALQSVLCQDPGPERMQIEVIDNCSTESDPQMVVKTVGGRRVSFHRQPKNEGAIANFNACIQRSRGFLVHILHGDDYVLPGFYSEIERLADLHSDVALLATRSFIVDAQGIITGVSVRIPELERPVRSLQALYYDTMMLVPGVVIRREFHESYGGYMPSLFHLSDREMWIRAVSLGGGVLSASVMACYRRYQDNHSSAAMRSGDVLRELFRLNDLLGNNYSDFSKQRARQATVYAALKQARKYAAMGDTQAAQMNWRLWLEHCSWRERLKEALLRLARLAPSPGKP